MAAANQPGDFADLVVGVAPLDAAAGHDYRALRREQLSDGFVYKVSVAPVARLAGAVSLGRQ